MYRLRPTKAAGALGVVIVACLASPGWAGDWQGQEKTLDGATHVSNPAEAMEPPITISLQELWTAGGDDEDSELFGRTGRILLDESGNSYILDRQLNEIKVYAPSGEFLRTIGRDGEGPGEFRNAADMFVTPGGRLGVLQMMPGRIVQLSHEGEAFEDFSVDTGEGFVGLFRGRSQGDNVVIAVSQSAFSEGKLDRTSFVATYDANGEESHRYWEENSQVDFGTLVFEEVDLDGFNRHWTVLPDGRVAVATKFGEYSVHVYTPDGKLDRVVHRDYEADVRNDQEKEDAAKQFQININGREAQINVSDVNRPVDEVYPRPNGELWVRTSRAGEELPDGCMIRFDVFDAQGRYVREVLLRGDANLEDDAIVLAGDRLFVVENLLRSFLEEEEEEDAAEDVEPLHIICYQLGTEG